MMLRIDGHSNVSLWGSDEYRCTNCHRIWNIKEEAPDECQAETIEITPVEKNQIKPVKYHKHNLNYRPNGLACRRCKKFWRRGTEEPNCLPKVNKKK